MKEQQEMHKQVSYVVGKITVVEQDILEEFGIKSVVLTFLAV